MKLISVNVAMPAWVEINGRNVLTGINKKPQANRIWLSKDNLAGDGQADLNVHGGEFRAAYSYPVEHYAYWQQAWNTEELLFGTFGENFTVSGLLEDTVYVGDIFKIGEAVVQTTMPRTPCFKFGHKMGRSDILQPFLTSGRSGFYHKVIEAGEVGAGDDITLLEHDSQSISIRMALGLLKLKEGDAASLSHALTIKSLPPLLAKVFTDRLAAMVT